MVRELREWLLHLSVEKGEEFIGATITLLALLTATATLAGHRAHTEEVKLQTKSTDQWGFYQAKHIRSHMYGIEAEKALASSDPGVRRLAPKYLTTAIYEQCGEPAESCNIENCRTADQIAVTVDPTKACNVPVLKDSPELLALLSDNLLKDHSFRKRFFPSSVAGVGKVDVADIKPEAMASMAPAKKSEPPSKKLGAAHILDEAKSHDHAVDDTTEEALLYDISEVVLEVSIMICSFAVVVGTKSYRKSAYFTVIVAMIVATAGVGVSVGALWYHVQQGVFVGTIGAAVMVGAGLLVWMWLYRQEPGETRLEKAAASPEPLL